MSGVLGYPQDMTDLTFVHFDTHVFRTKNWYRTMLTGVYPEAMGGAGFGLGVRCKRHVGDAESMRPKKLAQFFQRCAILLRITSLASVFHFCWCAESQNSSRLREVDKLQKVPATMDAELVKSGSEVRVKSGRVKGWKIGSNFEMSGCHFWCFFFFRLMMMMMMMMMMLMWLRFHGVLDILDRGKTQHQQLLKMSTKVSKLRSTS